MNLELLKLTLPILLSNWIYAIQSFVILLSVSGLGNNVIAGVGFASTLVWLLYGIDELVYSGIAVLTASNLGEGKRVGRFVFYGMFLSTVISLPVYLFGEELLSSFLTLFNVKGRALEAAINFVEPIVLLLPIVLTTNSLNAVFNGTGKTKELFYGSLLVFTINIALLPILVPKLAEKGAGWSVAISESAASLYYLSKALKSLDLNPFKDLKFSFKEIGEIVRVGFPAGVEETISSLSYNVFTGLVAICGTQALAAFQIGLKVEGIAAAVGFSLLDASIPFIGQAKGETLKVRVKELVKTSVKIGVIVGTLLILLSYPVLFFFNVESEVKRLSFFYLLIAGISEPSFILSMALTGVLRALKKTEVEATVNVVSFWLLRIAPSWAVLKFLKSPLVPWGFMGGETILKSLILLRTVRRYLS
ncbi:MAG: MATE family efflux transporter [Desulfurobacteriaceae bacterium]